MHKMNFPWLWRKWIMVCVTTASASIIVNGSPIVEFRFERRLRQGDSFSSFRFLIAAEDLNVLMNALVNVCFFSNYQVGRTDIVRISHLQFADDTLLDGNKS